MAPVKKGLYCIRNSGPSSWSMQQSIIPGVDQRCHWSNRSAARSTSEIFLSIFSHLVEVCAGLPLMPFAADPISEAIFIMILVMICKASRQTYS